MACLPSISLLPACLLGFDYIPSAHLVALTLLRELIEFYSSPRSRFLLSLLLTFRWDKTCCLHIVTHLPQSTVKFTSVMSAGRLRGLTGSGFSPLYCYISSMCHHMWLMCDMWLAHIWNIALFPVFNDSSLCFFLAFLFPAVVKYDIGIRQQVEIVWSSFFLWQFSSPNYFLGDNRTWWPTT